MSGDHVVQRAVPQWLRNVVPRRKVHVAPERQVALDGVDRRVQFHAFIGDCDRDRYRRRIDARGIEIDRRWVGHRCADMVPQR